MRHSIRVFVSSDMAELEPERETAENIIHGLNLEPRLFELIPATSQSPGQACLVEVRDCHIFVLLVWRSFPPAVRAEYQEAIEQGKPILVFVKLLAESEGHSPDLRCLLDQLGGEAKLQTGVRTLYSRFRRLSELSARLRDALVSEIAKFYRAPRITLSRKELYDLGTDIVTYAQRQLHVVQRTPSLFLGSRPYLARPQEKFIYEERFRAALAGWIEAARQASRGSLLYLFSADATRKEIAQHSQENPTFRDAVVARARQYKDFERDSGLRLRFAPLRTPFSGPMIVGDNRLALWLLGREEPICISQENHALALEVIRMLETHGGPEQSADELIRELGA